MVLRKFNSFGGSNPLESKSSAELGKEEIDYAAMQKKVQELTKKLEMKEMSESFD